MQNLSDIQKFLQARNDMTNISTEGSDTIDYHGPSWGLDLSKGDYESMEQMIHEARYTSEDYEIFAWCDVSGYEYWTLQQEENNYIMVTIRITNPNKDFSESELEDIDEKVFSILDPITYNLITHIIPCNTL